MFQNSPHNEVLPAKETVNHASGNAIMRLIVLQRLMVYKIPMTLDEFREFLQERGYACSENLSRKIMDEIAAHCLPGYAIERIRLHKKRTIAYQMVKIKRKTRTFHNGTIRLF